MTVEAIIKVAVGAGATLALGLGGGAWRNTIANEHRITSQEAASVYQAKALDANLARLLLVEQKFDGILLSLGRIEGKLEASGRPVVRSR